MDDQRSHLAATTASYARTPVTSPTSIHPTLLLPGAANYCIVSPSPPSHRQLVASAYRGRAIETEGRFNGCEKLIIRFLTD